MTITVKVFASLREQLGFDVKVIDLPDDRPDQTTVAQIWALISDSRIPENLLSAINHEYASLEKQVEEGDEVAFFPPVNGG